MAMRASAPSRTKKTSRYPWHGGGLSRGQRVALVLALLMAGGLISIYVAYLRSGDVAPDSAYGYVFAFAGTLLFLLVGAGYALRKRLRRNWSGLLHTALTWHVAGGALALALILMHAAGNFHPRTGSYALYSLIALVVSGFIGRLLDRISPRLAAKAALQALTADGEERLETLVDGLVRQPTARDDRQRNVRRSRKTGVPWDIAYYDLSAGPGEIPALLNRRGETMSHRAAPQHAHEMPGPASDSVVKSAMASESAAIGRAIGTERLFLHLVRVWRYLHTAISVVTLALILWHLEYAATLLIGAR